MILLGFLFLLFMHFFSGHGIISLFRLSLPRMQLVTLSLIVGVVALSFIPFLLQLCYIPITFTSVMITIILFTLVLNIQQLKSLRKATIFKLQLKPGFKIYEWPFMILFAFCLLASVWRAYYMPPVARDMLSGPEVIAEYTVKEHSMINSVFQVNLETTNNYQKPPFITCLQIIYKLFGFPFGQVWISIMSLSFLVFLYQVLAERVHRLIACTLMLFFLATPELYAYTYLVLFDYSNMVLFFLGLYFLWNYVNATQANNFFFSAFCFGLATYIRSETLILVVIILPLYWIYARYQKQSLKKVLLYSFLFVSVPFIMYYIWVGIFLKYYMPGNFSLVSQVNPHLSDLSPIINRFIEMNQKILMGKLGESLWGYYMLLFLLLLAAEIIFVRRLSKETRFWLYGVLVVYLGMPLMGYLLPLIDISNTTKRGLFKMLPLMLMVMCNNGLIQRLSLFVNRWENELPVARPIEKKIVRAGKK